MAKVVPVQLKLKPLPTLSRFLHHLLLICTKRSQTWHWVVVWSKSYCLCACSRKMTLWFAPNKCHGTHYIYAFCEGNSGRQLTNIVDIFWTAESRTGKGLMIHGRLYGTGAVVPWNGKYKARRSVGEDEVILEEIFSTWKICTVRITKHTARRFVSLTSAQWQVLSRKITNFVFNSASGCLYARGFFMECWSVIKHNSITIELTIFTKFSLVIGRQSSMGC